MYFYSERKIAMVTKKIKNMNAIISNILQGNLDEAKKELVSNPSCGERVFEIIVETVKTLATINTKSVTVKRVEDSFFVETQEGVSEKVESMEEVLKKVTKILS
jgi:hypothetical protein